MNSRSIAVTAAVVLALPAAALAQSTASSARGTGWTMPWQGNFWGHVGFSYGQGRIDLPCPPGSGCDDTDQAFRVFGGGRFNNAVGGEIGYVKFGDFNRGGGETDADAWDLALVAGIPFGNNWSIFGKLGAAYARTEVTGTAPGLVTGTENDWGIRYGLGLQAGITQNFALRADWDRFELPVPGGDDNVDLLMVGVQWSFR